MFRYFSCNCYLMHNVSCTKIFLHFALIPHKCLTNSYKNLYLYIWKQIEQHFLSFQILKHGIFLKIALSGTFLKIFFFILSLMISSMQYYTNYFNKHFIIINILYNIDLLSKQITIYITTFIRSILFLGIWCFSLIEYLRGKDRGWFK